MKKNNILIFLFFSVYFFSYSLSFSAGVSNRPTNTNSALPIGKGKIETSLGTLWQKAPGDDQTIAGEMDLSYGATEDLELGFKFPYSYFNPNIGESTSGLGQFNVFFLFNFVKEKENSLTPSASFSSTLYVKPSSYAKNTDSDGEDIDAYIIVSKYFGDHNIEFNIGLTVFGDEGLTFKDTLNYFLADEWDALSWLTIIAEVYGQTSNTIGENEQDINTQVGLVFNISDNFKIDAGSAFGLTGLAEDIVIKGGITLNF
jgi:hypothetical protein